jgi:hypothetical protein
LFYWFANSFFSRRKSIELFITLHKSGKKRNKNPIKLAKKTKRNSHCLPTKAYPFDGETGSAFTVASMGKLKNKVIESPSNVANSILFDSSEWWGPLKNIK